MGLEFVNVFSRGEIWIVGASVVALLVVIWAMRSATGRPTSSDDQETPAAGLPERIIAAVAFGFSLILAGAYVAITRGILWSLPLFGLGFGLVVSLMAVNQRFRHGSSRVRRTIDLAGTFVNSALLAGILLALNVIAFRYWSQPLDLTRERIYTLSSTTLNQLKSLDRPVVFTLIFGRGPRAVRQRERLVQLLDSYKAVNPDRIKILHLDPFVDQSRIDDLAKRFPEVEQSRGGGLVIETGEGSQAHSVVVRSQDLFQSVPADVVRTMSDRFESAFKGEDEVTSALIRLREGKKWTVGFITGHGERSTTDFAANGAGIGNWRARLNKVGCDAVDLNLIHEEIPPDLSLLIVVAPRSPFKSEEVFKLQAYAAAGRPLLLLLGNTDPHGLDEFLKMLNVEIGRGLLVEPKLNYKGNPTLVFAPIAGELKHPIVDAMGTNRAVLLANAAPIHVLGHGASAPEKVKLVDRTLVPTVILRSSAQGWAETDLTSRPPQFDPKVDEHGPVAVGVAVSYRASPGDEGSPRLVLFSCPSLADNVFQEIEPTNLDALMNATSWLRNRASTLGLPAKTHVALTLTADPLLRSRLILVPTVTSILLIIAVGLLVYVARRE